MLARARSLPSLLLLALVACGTEETPPDAGGPVGSECTGLAQCGMGTQNFVKVSFCEHCFARPDTHVCESGSCRAVDASAMVTIGLMTPREATGARSFTVASVNPVRADGRRVDCAALLAATDYVDSPVYSVGNSKVQTFNPPADPNLAYRTSISIEPGADRMIVVRVTSDVQGKGRVLAEGCVGGLDLPADGRMDVAVPLSPK